MSCREKRAGTGTTNVVIYLPQAGSLKMRCNSCSMPLAGSWLDKKETQISWVTAVISSEYCLPSGTNCRAVSSFPPDRWSFFTVPMFDFFFPPKPLIYQVWNLESNNVHSSAEISHETKTRCGGAKMSVGTEVYTRIEKERFWRAVGRMLTMEVTVFESGLDNSGFDWGNSEVVFPR